MLILKSGSPRRIKIFQDLDLHFQTSPSSIDESLFINENDLDYLKRITIAKLELDNTTYFDTYVSSDTIVVKEGKIYPKPLDFKNAVTTLTELNGTSHFVYSSVCIAKNQQILYGYDKTKIEFKHWSIDQIQHYIKTFQPFDKAGSYGVQDKHGPVKKIEGSYTNVLGFPIRIFLTYISEWKMFLNGMDKT